MTEYKTLKDYWIFWEGAIGEHHLEEQYSGDLEEYNWEDVFSFNWNPDEYTQKGNFKNGKKEGRWVGVEKSRIRLRENYKNGKLNGIRKKYWWNFSYGNFPQLGVKETYKNGELHGPCYRYWKNGQLDQKSNYKNGKKHGQWKNYRNNGQLYFTENYKKGELLWSWDSILVSGRFMMRLVIYIKRSLGIL